MDRPGAETGLRVGEFLVLCAHKLDKEQPSLDTPTRGRSRF